MEPIREKKILTERILGQRPLLETPTSGTPPIIPMGSVLAQSLLTGFLLLRPWLLSPVLPMAAAHLSSRASLLSLWSLLPLSTGHAHIPGSSDPLSPNL